jgi:hypothetical protein
MMYRAEVKFSNAFETTVRLKSSSYRRTVFKWAAPRGKSGKHTVDAIILIGLDVGRLAYSWVLPRDSIAPDCRSITIATPSQRGTAIEGRLDRFAVPFDQILPAFARLVRRAGIKARAHAQRASGDLFQCEETV